MTQQQRHGIGPPRRMFPIAGTLDTTGCPRGQFGKDLPDDGYLLLFERQRQRPP